MTCPHSNKPCVSRHDCERCPVMQAFGWFIVWKRGKSEWVQRFILEKDRADRLAECDMRIGQAEADRVKILKIPTKEEYERMNQVSELKQSIQVMLDALIKADARLYHYHINGDKCDESLLNELQIAIAEGKRHEETIPPPSPVLIEIGRAIAPIEEIFKKIIAEEQK